MREVSGSTWSFQIIIIFILIFSGFLALVLTYNKAYTIKNRMMSIIEKYEGVTTESLAVINSYVNNQSYNTTAKCPVEADEVWYGTIDKDGLYEVAESGKEYYYCFHENKDEKSGKLYYDVVVFYRFNLPFLGDIFTYKISGETKPFIGNPNRIGAGS